MKGFTTLLVLAAAASVMATPMDAVEKRATTTKTSAKATVTVYTNYGGKLLQPWTHLFAKS